MGDEKKTIFDMVDSDVIKEANKFIKELKAGKTKRASLPNEGNLSREDYDDARALERMKALNRNLGNEQAVVNAYNEGFMNYDGDNGR